MSKSLRFQLAFIVMSCYYETQRLQRKERKMVGFVPGHTILDRLPISMCGIIHVYSGSQVESAQNCISGSEQPKPEAAFCAAG